MPTSKVVKRLGAKDNDIKHFSSFLPNFKEIEIIVEPFAGSFAVSKYIMKTSDKELEYHINDIDPTLYFIYTNTSKWIEMHQEIAERLKEIRESEPDAVQKRYHSYLSTFSENPEINKYLLDEVMFKGILIRPPNFKNLCQLEQNILMDAIKTNYDYKIILDQYRDNKDAFLFLDPPYMFSNNMSYAKQCGTDGNDNTDMVLVILDYLKTCKCKVMLIINKLHILDHFFKDYKKGEYTTIYKLSNRLSKHLIITNY